MCCYTGAYIVLYRLKLRCFQRHSAKSRKERLTKFWKLRKSD
jgi:hypothetical protein